MENEIGRRVHDKGSVRTDVSTAFQESDYGGSCSEPSATGLAARKVGSFAMLAAMRRASRSRTAFIISFNGEIIGKMHGCRENES